MRLFAICKFNDIATCPDNKVLHDNGGITVAISFKSDPAQLFMQNHEIMIKIVPNI